MKTLQTLACSSLLLVAASAIATPAMVFKASAMANGGGQTFCKENFPGSLTCIPFANDTSSTVIEVNINGTGAQEVDPGWILVMDPDNKVVNQVNVVVKNGVTGKKMYSGMANNFEGVECVDASSGIKCTPWH